MSKYWCTIYIGPINYWPDNGKIYINGYQPIIKLELRNKANNMKADCFIYTLPIQSVVVRTFKMGLWSISKHKQTNPACVDWRTCLSYLQVCITYTVGYELLFQNTKMGNQWSYHSVRCKRISCKPCQNHLLDTINVVHE